MRHKLLPGIDAPRTLTARAGRVSVLAMALLSLALVVFGAPGLAVADPAAAAEGSAVGVHGDYVEARTSDVWTGPCFANGEVNLEGQEAILAWRVREGRFLGVDLSGLSVAAVVTASATLGDPYADPLPARSVIVVDAAASAAQRRALVGLAREMGGDLLADVVDVEAAPVALTVDRGVAHLVAGAVAELTTRPLNHHDRHCGNETLYYPPLTGDPANVTPAATVVHTYRGDTLGRHWSSPNKRSAYVGSFAR